VLQKLGFAAHPYSRFSLIIITFPEQKIGGRNEL
jgi:hypothetical protein